MTAKNFAAPFFSAARNAFSVPTSTPEPAEVTISTASAALTASAAPPSKSKRPGASIILSFVLSHSSAAMAEETDDLRRFSSESKSRTVLPSATLPSLSEAPAM